MRDDEVRHVLEALADHHTTEHHKCMARLPDFELGCKLAADGARHYDAATAINRALELLGWT